MLYRLPNAISKPPGCYFKHLDCKKVSNHTKLWCRTASDAISKPLLRCILPATVRWLCHTYSNSMSVPMLFLATCYFKTSCLVNRPGWAFLVRLGCAGGGAFFGEFFEVLSSLRWKPSKRYETSSTKKRNAISLQPHFKTPPVHSYSSSQRPPLAAI